MRIDCAPMEGITGQQYRLAHKKWFGGIDRYYIPFLSPTQTHSFSSKSWREVLPENNPGICVIPQLLTRNADDFIWAAKELSSVGYQEVNLNLGCPSGTVVAKGKGSGFLAHPTELKEFLDRIFSSCSIKISIKTRLGLSSPDEFNQLLDIYQGFPVHELIIHPRIQKDFYKLPARRDEFASCVDRFTLPVCYNGDLSTVEQCRSVIDQFPFLRAVMLGRGLIGDPALAKKMNGGPAADATTLEGFHNDLYENYCIAFQSRRNAMMRMKEMWFYMINLFDHNEKAAKLLRKTSDSAAFESQVKQIFHTLPLRSENNQSCS